MAAPRTLQYIALDEITSATRNPKAHAADLVTASIDEFGYLEPMLVDERTGRLVAGHGRLEELRTRRDAGAPPPEGIRIRAGHWLAPVVRGWSSRDDDHALAAGIALNRVGEAGGWDVTELALALGDLKARGQMTGTGFTDADLAALIVGVPITKPILTDPDDVPAKPAKAKSRIGDIVQLGEHRLLVGDITKPGIAELLLAGDSVECVWTDPPYNVAYQGGTKDQLEIQNDNLTEAEFAKFLAESFAAIAGVLRPGGAIYVAHSDVGGTTFRQAYMSSGLLLKQILIWVKDRFVLGRQDYQWQHEPILYGWAPGAAHRWRGTRNRATTFIDEHVDPNTLKKAELVKMISDMLDTTTVIRCDRPSRSEHHPTMKPVALVAGMIANSTLPGDIVMDPFAGSGTTMIACEQTGRIARLIEIDPHYADVIVERWARATGGTPRVERARKTA